MTRVALNSPTVVLCLSGENTTDAISETWNSPSANWLASRTRNSRRKSGLRSAPRVRSSVPFAAMARIVGPAVAGGPAGDDYRACGAATTSISIIAPGSDERSDLDERAGGRLRPEVLAPDLANRGQVVERGHVRPHLHDVGERRALGLEDDRGGSRRPGASAPPCRRCPRAIRHDPAEAAPRRTACGGRRGPRRPRGRTHRRRASRRRPGRSRRRCVMRPTRARRRTRSSRRSADAPLPWMNSSTISRAASSLNCTGGDFMK